MRWLFGSCQHWGRGWAGGVTGGRTRDIQTLGRFDGQWAQGLETRRGLPWSQPVVTNVLLGLRSLASHLLFCHRIEFLQICILHVRRFGQVSLVLIPHQGLRLSHPMLRQERRWPSLREHPLYSQPLQGSGTSQMVRWRHWVRSHLANVSWLWACDGWVLFGTVSQVIAGCGPGSLAEPPQVTPFSEALVTSPSLYVFPIWIVAAFLVRIIPNVRKYRPPHM